MTACIVERIKSADKLPTLPQAATEVLRLTQADDVSVADIAKVVQRDPALTVKVLKTVNSPLFGMPREIASLQQAMVVLGLRTVKVLVLSFSLVEAMQTRQPGRFNYTAYWRRSLTTAVAARLLGRAVSPRIVEEAFVAGLLADIGMIAAWRCAEDLYQPVLEAWSAQDRPLHEIEREVLGVTHAELGGELLKQWSLPQTLISAVAAHTGEGLDALSGAAQQTARVVHAASLVAGVFCNEVPSNKMEDIQAACRSLTGIDEAVLEEALDQLDKHVREMASLLSLDVGETVDYGKLQWDASSQLVQLSMQMEMERAQSAVKAEEARREADRLRKENKTILKMAATDRLTRVANRAAFDQRLDEELARAEADGSSLGLLLLDVDQFKLLNDTHGHQAGDAVLREIGACLRETVHNVGFVARYGGEEFAVILMHKTATALRELAESIRLAISGRHIPHDGQNLRVTGSIGGAWTQPRLAPTTVRQLVEVADRQLYRAKRNGRNRVEL